MNIRLITLLSVLVLAAVSCDDSEMASAWDDPRYVHLVAPMEDVTGSTAQELSFQTGQQMKVWERNGNSVALSADSDSTFISHDWIPKAVPAYAAFPARENVSCTSDGVFCLAVDSVQKVMTPGTVENFVAVGKVSGHQRTSYRVGQMRNVTGFLALNLGYPLVTSIKVEAVAGEPMAGKITVDHARLEGGEVSFYEVADSASASVTLVPSVADTTLSVGTYHLALLPGTYSNGFRITVNYQSGTPVEMTCFGEGVTVERSGVSSPGAGYADDDLPEEVRIDLDFAAGWPFKEECVSVEEQTAAAFAGDTYTLEYKYQHEGLDRARAFQFFIKGNAEAYQHTTDFKPGARNSRITLPSVPGRYIRAVRYETQNGMKYPKGFQLNDMDWDPLAASPVKSSKGYPATLSFPTEDGIRTGFESSYYMYFSDASAAVSKLSILYTRELPASYESNPFGDEICPEELPDEITVVIDFSKGWPFDEACVPADSQTDDGEIYSYSYGYWYRGQPKTTGLKFLISRCGRGTKKSYEYSAEDQALCFSTDVEDKNSTAMMTLPVIPGKYIKEIRAVHCNMTKPYPRFNITQNFGSNITAGRTDPGDETVFVLPQTSADSKTTITSELNHAYSLRTRDPGMKVSKITIVYTDIRPE